MPWKNQNKIGFTDLVLPERLLELLKDDINGSTSSDLVDTLQWLQMAYYLPKQVSEEQWWQKCSRRFLTPALW